MVIRMKHTKGKRNRVRSHHALKSSRFVSCGHCGKPAFSHLMCKNCGRYAGRQIVDVLAKLDKKERKIKEKELRKSEEEAAEKGKK